MRHLISQQTRTIIPLILIIFIDSLGYMVSIPAFLRLFTEHSQAIIGNTGSPALANVLFSLSIATGSFGYMLGAPIIGTWSDSWGRKRTLVFSLVLSIIGLSMPIIGIHYSSLTWILVGRFLAGIASSSQSLAQTAVADLSEGNQKAWYFALIAVAMTVSLLIGPPIGAYLSDPTLVSWFNEATPFYATLLLIFFTLYLTLKSYNNSNHTHQDQQIINLSNLKLATKEAFAPGKVRRLFIIFFLYELGWSFYYQDISLYLIQKYDYSVTLSSQFLAYTGIWMALGLTFLYKKLTRRLSLDSLLNWSLIACTLSFISCAFAQQSFLQWIFVVPGAIGVGMAYPTIMALISNSVEKNKQGSVLGFAAAAFSAPWGVSALLSGPLSNISLFLPILIAALCLLGASALCYKNPLPLPRELSQSD